MSHVPNPASLTRRAFVASAAAAACAHWLPTSEAAQPLIDIHQHTHYKSRTDENLIAHHQALGARLSVLLPAGSQFGLEADCFGNDSCLAVVKRLPKQFVMFANEVPYLPETKTVIEKYLKAGAIGIGEQKFEVECDGQPMQLMADIAQHFDVPLLMHFQHGKYNTGYDRFYKMLEKYPKVNFIAHAQTFWGNIGKLADWNDLYPKGKITPGGLSDKWLGDYANFYGDLSAGSGLNAITRDEEFARGFLARHQTKLMYGSDCIDTSAKAADCSGRRMLDAILRLSPNAKATQKMLSGNARRVLKLK